MTIFSDAAAACFAAVHEVMAEEWLLEPMNVNPDDVNAPARPDPYRLPVTFPGIFFDPEAKPLIPNAFDPRTDQRPGTAAGKPRIEVAPGAVAMSGGIVRNDLLTRLSDGSRWRVSSTHTSAQGLLLLHVNGL